MARNIANAMQEYVKAMIDKVPGLKVLVLDSETTAIVSMVYSQSQILEKEIFLVEKIDSPSFESNEERMRHLNAICFLRPVADNFLRITKELKKPHYASYHVFFSNRVDTQQLGRIARFDEFDLVKEVHEYYSDVLVFGSSLFALNLPSTSALIGDQLEWSSYEETLYARLLDGLFSSICATKLFPLTIRFPAGSQLCSKLALHLQIRLNEENSLFTQESLERRNAEGNILLLMDRRDDPVTPLLNQWTYRGMVHELIGIENNRVDMRKVPGSKTDNMDEIVMSPLQDQFYAQNVHANFGDLGVVVKKYVDMFQEESRTKAKVESIEDMQNFVDKYPEFRRLSGCVSKHVAVIHELSRLVNMHGLLDISSIEQELACHEQKEEQFQMISEKLKTGDVSNMERLRLVLLFALRYEGDQYVTSLKNLLRTTGMDEEQIRIINTLLAYAGSSVRNLDLFQNRNFLALAKNTISRGLKGTSNVYTQHKSLLSSILEQLLKGRLKDLQYSLLAIGTSAPAATLVKEKPAQVVAFVVGGTTYEEARDVDSLAASTGVPIILGGSHIHNSRSFLADLTQLSRGHRQPYKSDSHSGSIQIV